MTNNADEAVRDAHRARNAEKVEKDIDEKKDRRATDVSSAENGQIPTNLSFKQRLRHFTFAMYTSVMSTGGLVLVIGQFPIEFRGQYEIGVTIYIFNLLLFLIVTVLIISRFVIYKRTLRNAFIHPTESLFIPCAVVSVGVLLSGGALFGTPKLGNWWTVLSRVIYWLYCAIAVVGSGLSYLTMWSCVPRTVNSMTPVWIFPIYPCLLVGPITSVVTSYQPYPHNIRMLVAGAAIQGIGFLIALMVYAAYISRLMTDKLPDPSNRPGMFVSVGPSAFTTIGLIGMGKQAVATNAFGETFVGVEGQIAQAIIRVVTVWAGTFLWGLSLWFAMVTIGAHLVAMWNKKLHFRLNWFSFVFPQTALVIATYRVGESFDAPAIEYFGAVMACILVLVWVFIFVKMIIAIYKKDIMWPGKDEDRSEGGFMNSEKQHFFIADDRKDGLDPEEELVEGARR